ncbi:MAG: aminotransferase class I/II-fold pyridoxal phosphate-dependent enzyme [Candidatus Methanoperedens sp.]|nr:aminotransferase class I/II-fold pyridoxal phosphate-dependent enzyme [Candidatus Methanoperedens sp.]
MELTPCFHGARVAESAERCGKKTIDELIDFSVNLNPLGPPGLRKKFLEAFRSITNYPDNRYLDFRKAAADSLGIFPDNIIPGNGSSELIRLFAETLIEPGDEVVIPHPTFGEYEFQCRLFGAEIKTVAYEDIVNLESDGIKAVFLCNPNNPTGQLLERKKVLDLAKKCMGSETFLFVDEAFIELSDPKESIADYAADNDLIFVLRSLTKTYSIPGIRIGFAVTSSDSAKIFNDVRLCWNLNSIAISIGIEALRNYPDYISRSLKLINKERSWLFLKLRGIRGFKPYPSDTNFILIDIGDFIMDPSELSHRMLDHGIIIRDCTSFSLRNHIRIAVRKHSENRKLIAAFLNVISDWGKERAEKEIGSALERGTAARSRINCEYYPCHFEGQDCTFCFCPFYPCEDERTGGEYIQRTTGGTVWSCAGCDVIHRGQIAEKVLKGLMKERKIKEIWNTEIEPILA